MSVSQRSSVGQWRSVGQRSTQKSWLGSNTGNDGQDNKSTITMFKSAVVILAIVACVAAKPGLLDAPLAYTSPLAYSHPAAVVAAPAPVVTATSSQVIARNFNGIAAAPVVAPVAAPVIAKYAAAPLAAPLAYTSPLAYSAPLSYAAAPAPLLI
ncbi:cuticle protein 38-like [Drosophila elegans]|uniref:cuticle protein 38-like n=1 Tax=Drosophila elegans TaxID=30023 RepID=UPI0007E64E24|nr:cuticle protein 38-like [Drosophila elegans]